MNDDKTLPGLNSCGKKRSPLFEEVGGLPFLERVHKIFYDKIYAHPWLKQFFQDHDQAAIETRQTQFMAKKMGAGTEYFGKEPYMAHRAMYITDELFDIRTELLRESLQEAGLGEDLIERWIKIDNAFKGQIVNEDIEEFYRYSWKYEQRVIIPRPKKEK